LDGRAAVMPFEFDNQHIVLRGLLQGKDSVTIVLDTGASNGLVDSARAVSAGIRLRGESNVQGAGGAVPGGRAHDVRVDLPGLELRDVDMASADLASLAAQAGRGLDLILGYPLLSRFVVEVDYRARRLRL